MFELYKNIKNRRIELKMSQEELAKKVGYSGKSMISKIERGEVDLSETMIKKFADALDVTAPELFGWDGINIVYKDGTKKNITAPIHKAVAEEYYLNEKAKEYAEFLHKNPNYSVLFDASRKVKPEDMQKALKAIGIFIDEN